MCTEAERIWQYLRTYFEPSDTPTLINSTRHVDMHRHTPTRSSSNRKVPSRARRTSSSCPNPWREAGTIPEGRYRGRPCKVREAHDVLGEGARCGVAAVVSLLCRLALSRRCCLCACCEEGFVVCDVWQERSADKRTLCWLLEKRRAGSFSISNRTGTVSTLTFYDHQRGVWRYLPPGVEPSIAVDLHSGADDHSQCSGCPGRD